MSESNLNPEIIRFKDFINKHPKLIKDVRKSGRNWQEIFEQWVLLGEDDIYWEQFQEDEVEGQKDNGKSALNFDVNSDIFKQVLKYTETIDVNKLQEQVQQLSKTLATVQEIVSKYQQTNKNKFTRSDRNFHWFHD